MTLLNWDRDDHFEVQGDMWRMSVLIHDQIFTPILSWVQ